MSEEEVKVQDPVVQEEKKEEVSILAEDTTPAPDVQEKVADEVAEVKTIPKERFNEVYARAKREEAERKQLQEELRREREERIRLEERQKVQVEQQTQKELTWAELETHIAEGRCTRDQAQEYKEKMTEQRLERKFKERYATETATNQILGEIRQYQSLVPDSMTPGSDSRQKYEKEYAYMTRTLGMPQGYATEVAALRAAFGDIETVKSRQTLREKQAVITSKEPFQETHMSSTQTQKPTKSWRESLPESEQEHWKKMIKHNVVKDWKEAEALAKRKRTLVKSA
jgi:hypothetical protein